MNRIGIKYHEGKVKRAEVDDLSAWLQRNGKTVTPVCGKDCVIPEDLDLLIVMGGDGTLLSGARLAAGFGIPVIGIDFGGLGFLSEIKFRDARPALKKIFKGEYRTEERLMLEGLIRREGCKMPPLFAMNDIVISRHSGRMLRLKVTINNQYFHEFPGDGLIVSTATGSTAYALSAGGPIVSPDVDVIALTPICPHTLFARALIIAGQDVIDIQPPTDREDIVIIIDGQEEHRLQPGDSITVRRAPMRVRLVRVTEPNFYQRVRDKFHLT